MTSSCVLYLGSGCSDREGKAGVRFMYEPPSVHTALHPFRTFHDLILVTDLFVCREEKKRKSEGLTFRADSRSSCYGVKERLTIDL